MNSSVYSQEKQMFKFLLISRGEGNQGDDQKIIFLANIFVVR